MELLVFWVHSFFAIFGLCPLIAVTDASQCPDSNLAISGGVFTLSNMFNDGSVLRYICPEGYYPHPVRKRDCYSGQWDPAPTRKPPVCKKVTCPNPNVLENGHGQPNKQQYYVNDTTTYRCDSGYIFRGSATRVCQINGKWSGGTPICSRDSDHCPDPGTPPGASREYRSFNIDDKVTYSCNNKLKLIGSKVRVCQDDGQWSGKEPECYADFTYDTPEEVAEAFGSSLKTTLTMYEETGQYEKRIRLEKGGKLDIYIALDASNSIEEKDFNLAKKVITDLIVKISYYQVSPNYEIIIFASDVTRIISMADYKRRVEKKLDDIVKELENYKFNAKGPQTGTNIAKAYGTILDSISFEKAKDPQGFNDTHHVIIMFTDGFANMGENPKRKVQQIKEVVYDGDVKREKYLDLYVFGVGGSVMKQDLDEWVTKRDNNEKHLFLLRDMKNIHETFDQMIDESTSVGLCGLYKDYHDGTKSAMRLTYPWLMKIVVTHEDGTKGNCLGSLVTPKFILTAAHCFRTDDIPERIQVETPSAKDARFLKVKRYISHPNYNSRQKVKEGISEYYEYDVALIELEEGVIISSSFRTICIPCTKQTSGALKLSGSDVTCKQHKEMLMNNDLVKAFFMTEKKSNVLKKRIQIRQGQKRNACIEDAKNALNIPEDTAKDLITDNFLCSGGAAQNQRDDVSCKGDSGGATFVEQKYRAIQVGIVSWGLKDGCAAGVQFDETAKDFHIDLFSPKIQAFLKQYLGNEKIDTPLNFIE
ncbi:complement factor b, like [Trichomycterus rosablanca]|uniref:complement factor b, like n=1 Tax=Trichomycterus rosablanca TaxID=2290929 RepID=UPI002F35780A